MRSFPDWPAFLDLVWPAVADQWSGRVEGGRVSIAVEAAFGGHTVGRWEAIVDPAGPEQGQRALRAALARLLPRAGYPFEGTITVLAGADELARERVRVSRASIPASVRTAQARALREARLADAEKTRQMLDMHRSTPEVVFAAAALLKEAREMNVPPPSAKKKRNRAREDALVEMAKELMGRVMGVRVEPDATARAPSAEAPRERGGRTFDAWSFAEGEEPDGDEGG
ncbi:MAG: hypothetical protein ACOZNI_20920 [Myxococcota bacterium]